MLGSLPSRAPRLSHGRRPAAAVAAAAAVGVGAARGARGAVASRLLWLGGAALEASVARLEALAERRRTRARRRRRRTRGLATARARHRPASRPSLRAARGLGPLRGRGFVRVRGSDEGPLAAAAPPRGTPTVAQLEQLEALVSRLEARAAGPPVRAAAARMAARALALTPCALAGWR